MDESLKTWFDEHFAVHGSYSTHAATMEYVHHNAFASVKSAMRALLNAERKRAKLLDGRRRDDEIEYVDNWWHKVCMFAVPVVVRQATGTNALDVPPIYARSLELLSDSARNLAHKKYDAERLLRPAHAFEIPQAYEAELQFHDVMTTDEEADKAAREGRVVPFPERMFARVPEHKQSQYRIVVVLVRTHFVLGKFMDKPVNKAVDEWLAGAVVDWPQLPRDTSDTALFANIVERLMGPPYTRKGMDDVIDMDTSNEYDTVFPVLKPGVLTPERGPTFADATTGDTAQVFLENKVPKSSPGASAIADWSKSPVPFLMSYVSLFRTRLVKQRTAKRTWLDEEYRRVAAMLVSIALGVPAVALAAGTTAVRTLLPDQIKLVHTGDASLHWRNPFAGASKAYNTYTHPTLDARVLKAKFDTLQSGPNPVGGLQLDALRKWFPSKVLDFINSPQSEHEWLWNLISHPVAACAFLAYLNNVIAQEPSDSTTRLLIPLLLYALLFSARASSNYAYESGSEHAIKTRTEFRSIFNDMFRLSEEATHHTLGVIFSAVPEIATVL